MWRLTILAVVGSVMWPGLAGAQTAPAGSTGTAAPPLSTGSAAAPTGAAARATADRVAPSLGQLMQSNGGSLFRASLMVPANTEQAKLSQFSYTAVPDPEPKKIKKHDLITIVVKEESSSISQENSTLQRQADLNAQITQFIQLNSLLKGRLTAETFTNNAQNGQSTPPGVAATASRDLTAQGEIDRNDSLILRVQAEVIDVRPNGNLVLQARKDIKNDEEEQHIVLSGVCRAEDITPDNSVLSTQLADVSMQKNCRGAVHDNSERGLTQKIVDGINPF